MKTGKLKKSSHSCHKHSLRAKFRYQLISWLDKGVDPVIASAEKMEMLKRDVDATAKVVDLEEWYRNHQNEFSILTSAHYSEIIKYCGQRKQALLHGGNGNNRQVALF